MRLSSPNPGWNSRLPAPAKTMRWRIINICFGGVSGTDIQRAEFEVFLRDGGATRLRERLDELIRNIERGAR